MISCLAIHSSYLHYFSPGMLPEVQGWVEGVGLGKSHRRGVTPHCCLVHWAHFLPPCLLSLPFCSACRGVGEWEVCEHQEGPFPPKQIRQTRQCSMERDEMSCLGHYSRASWEPRAGRPWSSSPAGAFLQTKVRVRHVCVNVLTRSRSRW